VHHVVARDLAPLSGVIVLAVGVCALAGPAPREARVASRLALGGVSVCDEDAGKERLTVRQRQHAVSVCAMRFWVVPSSVCCGAASVCVRVALAPSIARSTVTGRSRGGRSRAYAARLVVWGDRHARPSPRSFARRVFGQPGEDTVVQRVHQRLAHL
jgi:hypothetical protein